MANNPQRALRQRLESLARAGVATVPRVRTRSASDSAAQPPSPEASVAPAANDAYRPAPPVAPPPRTTPSNMPPRRKPAAAPAAPLPEDERLAALEIVRREVAQCLRCDELCLTRTQTVFGVGNPRTRLVFCGEAPGADEDRRGEPFVGRAGQLLTKIIEACTLKREDVYILNVLKCRPPNNRNPLPDEVANCRGYLDRQLEIIQPEFICCLGAVAAQTLLETTTPIGQLRGRWHEYRGVRVMCTYHPAYLLRNPPAKKHTWDDMKWLMQHMGIEL